MKKQLLVLIGLVLIISAYGQNRGNRHQGFRERMKTQKVSFFTDKLELSVEESKAFWPLYNEYEKKKDTIIRSSRIKMMKLIPRESLEITDQELEEIADSYVESKIKEANLLKTYHNKFKDILPIKKVMYLYHIEDEYKSYLLKQIRGQGRGGRGMD